MDIMLFATLLFQVWIPGLGFENGAPASSCADMAPEHKEVKPQTIPAPYTITVSNSTFQAGIPIRVVIKGSDYAGILLQARSGNSRVPLGTWATAPANTKHLQCSGNNQGAITHANSVKKNNLTVFTWTPPDTSSNIYFVATIAKERSVYWLDVKSETLTREGGTAPGSADPKMAATPALLLLSLLISPVFQS